MPSAPKINTNPVEIKITKKQPQDLVQDHDKKERAGTNSVRGYEIRNDGTSATMQLITAQSSNKIQSLKKGGPKPATQPAHNFVTSGNLNKETILHKKLGPSKSTDEYDIHLEDGPSPKNLKRHNESAVVKESKRKRHALVDDEMLLNHATIHDNDLLAKINKGLKVHNKLILNANEGVSIELAMPKGSITCRNCTQIFLNFKELAVHHLIHLQIEACRIGKKVEFFPQTLRHDRMVRVDRNTYLPCWNCWNIPLKHYNILQQFVNGMCIYYCSNCGLHYFRNLKFANHLFIIVDGTTFKISYDVLPRDFVAFATPEKRKIYKCEKCPREFQTSQAR